MAMVTLRTILIVLAVCLGSAARGEIVWSQTFESGHAPEFSNARFSATPIAGRRFLGEYGNDSTTLTIHDLQPGSYRLEFDFFGIGTWDGNDAPGPDWFVLSSEESGELIRTTFAIGSHDTRVGWQMFPGVNGESSPLVPGRTGATENNTLGYFVQGHPRDAVWRIRANFNVAASTQRLTFRGEGLQGLADECWGLDNMSLLTVPAPGALVLAAPLGVMLRRRR